MDLYRGLLERVYVKLNLLYYLHQNPKLKIRPGRRKSTNARWYVCVNNDENGMGEPFSKHKIKKLTVEQFLSLIQNYQITNL